MWCFEALAKCTVMLPVTLVTFYHSTNGHTEKNYFLEVKTFKRDKSGFFRSAKYNFMPSLWVVRT